MIREADLQELVAFDGEENRVLAFISVSIPEARRPRRIN